MQFTRTLFLVAIIGLIACSFSFGQGTVRGKITDENGEAAINAIVFLQSLPAAKVAADFDGNFSLKIPVGTAQILIITFLGHDTIKESITVVDNEVIVKNFSLTLSGSNVMKTFEVTAKAVKAKDNYMEQFKMNSSVTVDYISGETMKKTGDPNVVAAVARVPGVSTNSGGLITVRGIGDRYVKTTVNGSRIPTLDPFTNNIRLDMFPATLVDNVIISKTASPDLPGDWAGAYLSVETKDYPDKFSVNVETTFGYNNNTSFRDVLTSERSTTDWLGYDNGFRDRDHSAFAQAIPQPTQYQEMVAIGLGGYYNSLGVTPSSWNSTFFNLGLVQLGLLDNSQLDDQAAIAAATNTFNTVHKLQAFDNLNGKAAAFGKSLPNNWDVSTRKAPLNFSQSFNIGDQVKVFNRQLGYIFGFRYGSSIRYDSASTAARIIVDPKVDTVEVISNGSQQISAETNSWSALMNLSYKLSNNHSVSMLFMPNLAGTNNIRYGFSTNSNNDGSVLISKAQFYEVRKQIVYQFKSEHYFPRPKLKVEMNASYTSGKSSAPDFKNLQYILHASGDYTIGGAEFPVQRFYRYLTENLFDSRLLAEFPLSDIPGLSRKLKFGGAYQRIYRKSNQYEYFLNTADYSKPFDGNINSYLETSNFGITSENNAGVPYHDLELHYQGSQRFWDHNIGYSDIAAGFAMMDYSIRRSLRFSGGVRVEDASIYTDALKFDTLEYASDDPRRSLTPGELNKFSILPSANVIYKLKDSEEDPINLRLNYSRTVARPSIRELSGYFAYDYELRSYVIGNPELKTVQINNYDLRLESYFKSKDNISVSFFYKSFIDHIELLNTGSYTWQNVDNSYVAGIELEGKKTIFKKLELRANITFVKSQSEFDQYDISINDKGELLQGAFQQHISRSMYGQAPYIINGIISYRADSLRLTTAISYNLQGPKLVIPGLFDKPNVYEYSMHLLDVKLSKDLGKFFNVSLTVRDIMNAPIRRVYRRQSGEWLNDYDKFRYGTNYLFGISYKL